MVKWAIRATTVNGLRFVYGPLKCGLLGWHYFIGCEVILSRIVLYKTKEAALSKAVALMLRGIPPDETLDVFEVTDGVVRGGGKGRKGSVRKSKIRAHDQKPGRR